MRLSQLLLLFVLCVTFIVASSSQENQRIADDNYANDPVQHFVATHLGDELPYMRDDLIARKNAGEGPIERHWHSWIEPDNWRWTGNDYVGNDWTTSHNGNMNWDALFYHKF